MKMIRIPFNRKASSIPVNVNPELRATLTEFARSARELGYYIQRDEKILGPFFHGDKKYYTWSFDVLTGDVGGYVGVEMIGKRYPKRKVVCR